MSILDDIAAMTPTQYKVTRVAFQKEASGLTAYWDVDLYNAAGQQLKRIHPVTQPDAATKAALATFYNDATAQFETLTGLTEYVPAPPEEPEL